MAEQTGDAHTHDRPVREFAVRGGTASAARPVEVRSPPALVASRRCDGVDRLIAVNIRGMFLAARAAAALMAPGGRIIGVGSCVTHQAPGPGATLYAMSKSAVVGLTKAPARELGGRGITANVVRLGPTGTDMNPADGPFADGQAAMTALGRFGTAEEVASAVAHLAGPEAVYVTGAELSVDGGYAA